MTRSGSGSYIVSSYPYAKTKSLQSRELVPIGFPAYPPQVQLHSPRFLFYPACRRSTRSGRVVKECRKVSGVEM